MEETDTKDLAEDYVERIRVARTSALHGLVTEIMKLPIDLQRSIFSKIQEQEVKKTFRRFLKLWIALQEEEWKKRKDALAAQQE